MPDPFGSPYSHGFVRLAAAVPHVTIAEPERNARRTLELAERASEAHAALVVFPELGLTGYSIEDLLHQRAVLDAALQALESIRAASAELAPVIVVGLPLQIDGGIYNTAAVVHRGRLLGVVVK